MKPILHRSYTVNNHKMVLYEIKKYEVSVEIYNVRCLNSYIYQKGGYTRVPLPAKSEKKWNSPIIQRKSLQLNIKGLISMKILP